MVCRLTDTDKARYIFEGWEESIIWSCIQGVMGEIYADDARFPHSAAAMLGDFVFFAGEPETELVNNKPEGYLKDFIIMVPQNDRWGSLIESCYGEKAKKISRYAIRKEPHVFDEGRLQRLLCTLPDGYELRMIDENIYDQCKKQEWSRDLVSQYKDYKMYEKLGLGAAILKEGQIVSGASSYSAYRDGIEIEVDTFKPYRRQGLASVCGAKLILECQKKKLYPSWDAHNKWSVALAKKLGYHYSHEYTAYEIWGY